MAANEYIPCLKCDKWVPYYVKEVHMAECHELALRQLSHPYITGSSLFGQVTIIGKNGQYPQEAKEKASSLAESLKNKKIAKQKNAESNQQSKRNEKLSTSRSINESHHVEPDWLKKILPTLHYRVILMCERDLIRCDITAYTPVEVKVGNTSCGFLAIPEDSVHIGHIFIHHNSMKYLPKLKDNAFVCVTKIECVRYVDEMILLSHKPFTDEENAYFEKQVKALLYTSYPLGAPFTLSIGCKIHLPSLHRDDTTFTVQSYKLTQDFDDDVTSYECRKEHELTGDSSDSIPSQLITIDEYDGSVLSMVEKVSKLQITTPAVQTHHLEETMNLTNPAANIWTSTPKRGLGSEGDQHSATFSSKIISKEISSITGQMVDTENFTLPEKTACWVRTEMNTRIILQSVTAGKVGVKLPEKVTQEVFCKDQAYHSLKKIMEAALTTSSGITDSPLLGRWSGVLLYGPPGTGKTCMVHEVAKELNVPVFVLTLATVSKSSSSAKEHLQNTFWNACQRCPSVLFMDEVESLCGEIDLKSQAERTLTPQIIQGIQTLQSSSKPVFLVAATSQPARVSSKLCSPGRLEREIMVPLPDAQQRGRIFQQLMSSHRHNLTEEDINSIAKKAYGFSGADLSVLVRCAWLACTRRVSKKEELKLLREDVCAGMQNIVPTMLRHNYSAVSMVKWHDIWGYQDIKMKLQRNIELYNHNPEKHPLKGLLLYGPPGCSKTMFVRALVHETGYSFFPLKCSNLLSKYVGETEKLLSQVFVRAQQAAPSVVFMDEVDSLCGERTGQGSLVSELLSLMAKTSVQKNVMVIGATNRPHGVDEALLRPGYLEQVIHVDLPDAESRRLIWRGVLEGVPQDGLLDTDKLSEVATGFSGAEITAVYQEAAFTALEKYIEKNGHEARTEVTPCPVLINQNLLMSTIAARPPRTPRSLLEAIACFTKQRKDHLLR